MPDADQGTEDTTARRGMPVPPWTMGLNGVGAAVANLTAVALICVMFYQQVRDASSQAREDRGMFREECRRITDQMGRQWDICRANQEAITRQTRAVEELAGELRRARQGMPAKEQP